MEPQHPTSLTLLERLRNRDDSDAWRRFHDFYAPLIRQYLLRRGLHPQDADDLQQDVMQVAWQELADFHHNGRVGSLRNWLRQVVANRLKTHWRRRNRPDGSSTGDDAAALAEQLADPSSPLSQLWDREYQQAVCQRLVALIRGEFQEQTVEAFRRVAVDGESAADVADELGITVNAVRIAQSRVLSRLRQLSDGMLD